MSHSIYHECREPGTKHILEKVCPICKETKVCKFWDYESITQMRRICETCFRYRLPVIPKLVEVNSGN